MSKFWSFIKNYSKIILIIVFGVVGILFLRKKHSDLLDEIEDLRDDHKEELEKIDIEREKERKAHKENEEQLKVTLDAIRRQYEEAKSELTYKKEKEVQKIVKQYGKNPDELSKQLSDATGFKVILPEPEQHEE
jgi:hypothetical protein